MQRTIVCFLFFVVAFVGCSSEPQDGKMRASVKGKVTLDGVNLTEGSIEFQPDGGGNTTLPIKNGAYSGKIVVGSSRVVITDPGKLIPPNYNDMSPLREEVKNGSNEFDFELKSKK